MRVADVMTPHPKLVSGQDSVAEFIDGAARSRQGAFPVISSAGELAGIVVTSQADDVPAHEWASRRLEQICLAVPPAYRADPGDPAAPLASRTPLGGEIAAVVLEHGRVIGMVTVSDLQRTVLRRQRLTTARM